MRWIPAAVSAALLAAAAGVFVIAPVTAQTSGTIFACIGGGRFTHVNTSSPVPCPSQTPVSWPGDVGTGPSPSPSPASPSPSATSASPSPSPTSASPSPSATGAACTGAASADPSRPADFACQYLDTGITMSNGFDTYDTTNCWGHPGCGYALTGPPESGNSATPWSVTGTEPAANTSVVSYPDTQQLTNNWTGGGWNGSGTDTDTPISGLASFSSGYDESMPHNAGTIAQAAWDIWTNYSSDIMVWVDNVNRGSGGADQIGHATIGGQGFTVYRFGGTGGEIIFSLDGAGGAGTFAQQSSGTVNLLPFLQWVKANVDSSLATVSQVDFGWEFCSTGGTPETFTLNSYSITATPS